MAKSASEPPEKAEEILKKDYSYWVDRSRSGYWDCLR
jgi:hypothetical protein